MQKIWGKSTNAVEYDDNTIEILMSMIDDCRVEFEREFKNAILDPKQELYMGTRYNTDDQILWVLRSNVSENDFINNPKHYIFRVLLGACSADHWYTFEKDWG